MVDEWRASLRAARRRQGLSLLEVAERAGLSHETIRGYENGRRRPRRDHLLAVLNAIEVGQHEVNDVLRQAGFAEIETLFPIEENPSFYFRVDELDAAVETVPWPQFVSSDTVEVLAANRAMQAVWDVDFAYERSWRTRPQMNMLSVASDHHFADRVVNWEEVISVLAGIHKGWPRGAAALDDPAPLLGQVLAEFARGDPVFLKRMIDIWVATAPMPGKIRNQYRVVWRDREFGDMRFLAQMTTCSMPDGSAFNDWHPIDADTWTALEQVKARWRATPPENFRRR
jgi:transcriptional regulator with XRE-family HTH domain